MLIKTRFQINFQGRVPTKTTTTGQFPLLPPNHDNFFANLPGHEAGLVGFFDLRSLNFLEHCKRTEQIKNYSFRISEP